MYKKFFLIICFSSFFIGAYSQESSNLDYVDTRIGGVGIILQPARPITHLPNSIVRVHPIRKDQLDDQVHNFPLTVISHRRGFAFLLMPVSGTVDESIWDKRITYRKETLTPYYYKVDFEDTDDQVEFTPQARSGFYSLHFKNNEPHHLRMRIFNPEGEINLLSKRTVSGFEIFDGLKAYFYAETDADIHKIVYRDGSNKKQALLDFGSNSKTVSFRYAISFISVEQAKKNLAREIPGWDFNMVKKTARGIWEEKMNQIQVKGGTEAQKRVFYTSLYRAYERMVDINEYGQYFSAYDNKIHNSDEPFYVDNWIWDNYIALEPLHMILNPDRQLHQIRSYIKMYEQGGYIPSFALVSGDWPAMIGNFAAAWIADAWSKGLRNFDLKTAYEGLKKNSVNATLIPWRNGPKTVLDDFYNEKGYMPGLAPGQPETVQVIDTIWEKRQSVSVTTGNSYADWCIAQLARELNEKEDEGLFLKRAQFYKNVYRADRGFMWPKDKEGNWIEPYDPRFAGREYFTENNAYIYNWDVKHDLAGLFELMGGTQKAEEKLDQLFREDLGKEKFHFWITQPDASGLVGQFVMGNEPSFHIPYIYNYMGVPWKTQKRIRMLLDSFFMDNIFGLPGDEDGGGMTAWVVMSMMGFMQVTQGIPIYSIGSPVFEEIKINLPNGKTFTVVANDNSQDNVYIQKATLNGKALNKSWFTHTDLMNGGKIEFSMGEKPNKTWGNKTSELPYSSLKVNE